MKATYTQILQFLQETDEEIVSAFEKKFPQDGEPPAAEEILEMFQARMAVLGDALVGTLQKLAAEEKKPQLILSQ